jgi:hypothetical protein
LPSATIFIKKVVLTLEPNFNARIFQVSDRLRQIDGVPAKQLMSLVGTMSVTRARLIQKGPKSAEITASPPVWGTITIAYEKWVLFCRRAIV